MAAKKKSDSSKDEPKKKSTKPAAKKPGRPKKKPEAPKKEELIIEDDDFGLDDITLDEPITAPPAEEETAKEAPKPKPKPKSKPKSKGKSKTKEEPGATETELNKKDTNEELVEPEAQENESKDEEPPAKAAAEIVVEKEDEEKVTDNFTPEPKREAEEVVVIDEIPKSGLMTDPETGWLKPTDENEPEEPIEEVPEEVEEGKEGEKEKKKGYLWLIITLSVIIIAALLYFCVFDKDDDEPVEEKIEEAQPVPTPEPEPEPVIEPEPEPEPQAAVYTISAPDGRFYVIVGSFYDVDLAEDKANELVEMGMDAFMLEPVEGFIFHRVAVKVTERQTEAFGALGGLKPEFGDDIWVVKF